MLNDEQYKRVRIGWLAFMVLAGFIIVVGLFLIQSAFAVNATAIDEIQAQLEPELASTNTFSVFWIILFFVFQCVFTIAYLRMREHRETIFFSISSLIISVLIAFIMTSPMVFVYTESNNSTFIQEIQHTDGNVTYNVTVQNTVTTSEVIPNDTEFRLALSVFFTGKLIFDGLYTIFILTQLYTKR